MAATDRENRPKHVEQAKSLLRELENAVEEIERDASLATHDRKVREAAAKGYRTECHKLVRRVMKLDVGKPEEGPLPSSYRFTNDMISEDKGAPKSPIRPSTPSYSAEDLEPSPEDVQEMRQTFSLEKKLIIGAFILLSIFLLAVLGVVLLV